MYFSENGGFLLKTDPSQKHENLHHAWRPDISTSVLLLILIALQIKPYIFAIIFSILDVGFLKLLFRSLVNYMHEQCNICAQTNSP